MAQDPEIAWNGRGARVVVARAALVSSGGRELLAAEGPGEWWLLDRSPVSVRVGRADGATARFEVLDDQVVAEIAGARWKGLEGSVARLDAEVRDGDVAFQDRA